jgi:hypothetical protein
MTGMRLVLVLVVAATAALAATAGPAYACSCAPPDPRSLLGQADGAFVGRLVSRQEVDPGRARFTFEVERLVKGALGSTVVVESASNSAACGIETPVGSRIGLFLERRDGQWTSSLCWQVSPEDLLAAAQPLPPPNGRGPATLLVAGRFGPARLLALDALGRTLAYGRGQGSVLQLSACPGGRRAAEVVQTETGVRVTIRELPGLRVVRQRPVLSPPGTSLTALRCETVDGTRLLLFHASSGRPASARLERLTLSRGAVLWRGSAIGATLTNRSAYVLGGPRGTSLLSVDLRTRRVRTVGRIPAPSNGLIAAPDGTELAGLTYPNGSRPALFRVRVQPFAIVTTPAVESGDLAFADRRRLVLLPGGGRRARVYGPTLAVGSSFAWTAYRSTVAGTAAYGVGAGGQLHRAPLPAGPERVVLHLPGPSVSAIVPVR